MIIHMQQSITAVIHKKPTETQLLQIQRMVIEVFAKKSGNKIVTVVMARLHAKGQLMARCFAGRLQQFGAQLR